jgi:hypothetical protein
MTSLKRCIVLGIAALVLAGIPVGFVAIPAHAQGFYVQVGPGGDWDRFCRDAYQAGDWQAVRQCRAYYRDYYPHYYYYQQAPYPYDYYQGPYPAAPTQPQPQQH